jgi:hypothetical protein
MGRVGIKNSRSTGTNHSTTIQQYGTRFDPAAQLTDGNKAVAGLFRRIELKGQSFRLDKMDPTP